MTPAKRLKEIESRQDSPKISFRQIRNDQTWLIARVKRLTEALESIACKDKPDLDDHSTWLKLSHPACADTCATDTQVARKALESEE